MAVEIVVEKKYGRKRGGTDKMPELGDMAVIDEDEITKMRKNMQI